MTIQVLYGSLLQLPGTRESICFLMYVSMYAKTLGLPLCAKGTVSKHSFNLILQGCWWASWRNSLRRVPLPAQCAALTRSVLCSVQDICGIHQERNRQHLKQTGVFTGRPHGYSSSLWTQGSSYQPTDTCLTTLSEEHWASSVSSVLWWAEIPCRIALEYSGSSSSPFCGSGETWREPGGLAAVLLLAGQYSWRHLPQEAVWWCRWAWDRCC